MSVKSSVQGYLAIARQSGLDSAVALQSASYAKDTGKAFSVPATSGVAVNLNSTSNKYRELGTNRAATLQLREGVDVSGAFPVLTRPNIAHIAWGAAFGTEGMTRPCLPGASKGVGRLSAALAKDAHSISVSVDAGTFTTLAASFVVVGRGANQEVIKVTSGGYVTTSGVAVATIDPSYYPRFSHAQNEVVTEAKWIGIVRTQTVETKYAAGASSIPVTGIAGSLAATDLVQVGDGRNWNGVEYFTHGGSTITTGSGSLSSITTSLTTAGNNTMFTHYVGELCFTVDAANGQPYIHTIEPCRLLSQDSPYYTIEISEGGQIVKRAENCKVSKIDLTCEATKPVMMAVDFEGTNATYISPANALDTLGVLLPEPTNTIPFTFMTGYLAFHVGSTLITTQISKINVSFDMGIAKDIRSNKITRDDIISLSHEATFDGTMYFDDVDTYKMCLETYFGSASPTTGVTKISNFDPAGQLMLLFQFDESLESAGSGTCPNNRKEMSIFFPNIRWSGATTNVDPEPKVMEIQFAGAALANQSGQTYTTGGTADHENLVQIHVMNTRSNMFGNGAYSSISNSQ